MSDVLKETLKDYNSQVPGQELAAQARAMFPQYEGFKEKNFHNESNPPQKGKVIMLCTCEHCAHSKAWIVGQAEEQCPCSYCN